MSHTGRGIYGNPHMLNCKQSLNEYNCLFVFVVFSCSIMWGKDFALCDVRSAFNIYYPSHSSKILNKAYTFVYVSGMFSV